MDRGGRGGRGATEEISALNRNYLQELPGSSTPHTLTHSHNLRRSATCWWHQRTSTVVKPPGSVGSAGLCQTTWCQSDPFSPDALRQSGEALPTRGRSLPLHPPRGGVSSPRGILKVLLHKMFRQKLRLLEPPPMWAELLLKLLLLLQQLQLRPHWTGPNLQVLVAQPKGPSAA